MSVKLNIACIQTNSGREIGPNFEAASVYVRQARDDGADLIALPENVSMVEPEGARLRAKAENEDRHQALAAFRDLARETGAWILIGSLAVKLEEGRIAHLSYLFEADGMASWRYAKIHMFYDALSHGDSSLYSATSRPGAEAVASAPPVCIVGICFRCCLRFPYL